MIIVIIVAVVSILLYTFYYNRREGFKSVSSENMLYTAYNTNFVCSKWLDNLPKHMRISRSGGPMYTSRTPPSSCTEIKCPDYVKDDLTPKNAELIDHYDDIIRYGQNDNLTCWQC